MVTGPDEQPVWLRSVRARLLRWYAAQKRDLPWRRTTDPYSVLVSEVMLVQTTVRAVIPFYERFLAQFPDVQTLAAASLDDVLKCWEGLGYYRRARQLHAAAQHIVTAFEGHFPRSADQLRVLPGVGPYIAGAVASIAFGERAPILEANSQRVLARLIALSQSLAEGSAKRRLWQVAAKLVPATRPGDFNQALMELGASVCLPRQPSCLICPLSSLCKARQDGLQQVIPNMEPRSSPLIGREAAILLFRSDRVLLIQRPEGGLWERFWEFPTLHLEGANPASRPAVGPLVAGWTDSLKAITGWDTKVNPKSGEIRYTVTRHRMSLDVHRAEAVQPAEGVLDSPRFRWLTLTELAGTLVSSPTRRVIKTNLS
jgi:A/G-specific adenine glycosylase